MPKKIDYSTESAPFDSTKAVPDLPLTQGFYPDVQITGDTKPVYVDGPFVRSAYNYDVEQASLDSGTDCGPPEESMTQQQFKEECDINTLVRRFAITGELPTDVRMPTYGDFSEVYDFHSAANAIAEARESFDAMPAEVRARFNNDPAKFVAFCSDDANLAEAEALGLLVPKERKEAAGVPPPPDPVPPVVPAEDAGK